MIVRIRVTMKWRLLTVVIGSVAEREKRSTNRRENLSNDLLLNGIVFCHWQWGWRLTRERSIKWRGKSNCELCNSICNNEQNKLSAGWSLIRRSVVFSQWFVKSVEGKEKKTICSRTRNQFSNRSPFVCRKFSDIPSLNHRTFFSLSAQFLFA